VPVRDDFEYGVLTDVGTLTVQGHEVSAGALLAVPPGAERIELTAGAAGARCLLLGQQVRPGIFGVVQGEELAPLPAPRLPEATLKPRRSQPWA